MATVSFWRQQQADSLTQTRWDALSLVNMQELLNSSLLAADRWGKETESSGANYVTISHRARYGLFSFFFFKCLSQSVLELLPAKSVLVHEYYTSLEKSKKSR